jgi:hypothetical protein
MNLNRCCSSSSARTRRSLYAGTKSGSGGSSGGGATPTSSSCGNTSYRSKKSLKFHSAATTLSLKGLHKASLRHQAHPSLGSIHFPNQAAVVAAMFTTATDNVSCTTTSSTSSSLGEVALAGILALISSATMMYTFPNPTHQSSSCTPADTTTACSTCESRSTSRSDCQFDPGGGGSDPGDHATTYATMALASSSFDQRPSFVGSSSSSNTEGSILHHHPTPNPKLKTVQSKVTDSSRDRPYDVRVCVCVE